MLDSRWNVSDDLYKVYVMIKKVFVGFVDKLGKQKSSWKISKVSVCTVNIW